MMQAKNGIEYIDLCASIYLTNNKNLFIEDLWLKNLDFIIVSNQILPVKNIRTITIPLTNWISIKLEKMAYAPDCDFHPILVCQLWGYKIIFIDEKDHMELL